MSTHEKQIEQLQQALAALQEEVLQLKQEREGTQRPPPSRSLSRRGLILGAGAAAAAAASGLTALPTPASAQTATPVGLGTDNPSSSTTSLSGSVLTGPAMRVSNYEGAPYDNYSDAFQAYTYGAGFAGVYGRNDAPGGAGIAGYSANGTGATFSGGQAAIQLQPVTSLGSPTSGSHQVGEIYVDSNGTLYHNVAAGTPGTWIPMISLVPFPDPRRVMQLAMTNGQTSSAISALTTITNVASGIPQGARAAWAAVQSYDGGVLTIFPDGAGDPGIANWAQTGASGVLKILYMLVPLSSAGAFRVHAYFTTTVYVDVWGYLM